MDLKNVTQTYINGELTIVWKPGVCIHSTICRKEATGLPEVFNPKKRPYSENNCNDTYNATGLVYKAHIPSGCAMGTHIAHAVQSAIFIFRD